MSTTTIISGYVISMFGGALLLWLLIDKIAWGYLTKHNITRKTGLLTFQLGVVERLIYTTAFIIGQPGFIPVWLALNVAAQWNRWQGDERDTYNAFLIGNALSIVIAYLGAFIAIQKIPLMPSP